MKLTADETEALEVVLKAFHEEGISCDSVYHDWTVLRKALKRHQSKTPPTSVWAVFYADMDPIPATFRATKDEAEKRHMEWSQRYPENGPYTVHEYRLVSKETLSEELVRVEE